MAKPLKRIANELWHYINGKKILGPCSGLRGDCSGLRGNCSGLFGDCSGLLGDCSLIPVDARPSLLENWVAD